MSDLLQHFESPGQVTAAAQRLRERALDLELAPARVIEVLERWGESLRGPTVDAIPGVAFLRLWLRRGTLEPIVVRELGVGGLNGEWHEERTARLRAYPLGVIGHWPAGNIEIQPLLSLSCALLGGNACLVRVPAGLLGQTRALLEKLSEVAGAGPLLERICIASFEHERTDLQRAMAAAVDGAMIWGGAEAITQIRALPFPPWARLAVFGPRLSVAAMDGDSWSGGPHREIWCQRLARDVWQFDQQACSSPQALFLERCAAGDVAEFAAVLAAAFEAENRLHPRESIRPALTSAICLARASWLLDDSAHRALLLGAGATVPSPTQGRTLSVLLVEDLLEPIARFDGMVQTLGLGVGDHGKEAALTQAAGRNGVDRIVKLGRMHVFGSPWDGTDLIRPMVRLVRHVPANGD
jgi:acyl-CoA reductase-like NAD-dependent aldehyde dehydrogenase